ncbi:hypothetical protein [Antiquaquibacter soli]|uniref:Uncharacterized protein n=1 Tax=Antiquaquibacter soli TaxID=3064523 RepID=A0ABT9BLG2_9MICO|nr:hypothetical protein [Protaetiibacter sp. WY-16]MDO7881287.1 hypothetical protein [Protaetiibacter sp. WY-16]
MTRPFTQAERELLRRLASFGPDAPVLFDQIDVAEHDGWWFEGSQSCHIATPTAAPQYFSGLSQGGGRQIGPGALVLSDPSSLDRLENVIGHAFFWLQDGRLSAFEYAWFTDDMPGSLPRLDQLLPH